MDNAVLATQQWLNATYSSRTGWVQVNEDGLTGWNVIYGLTRALQVELGITTLNQNFGTQTAAQLSAKYPSISSQTANVPTNIVKIIQGAMYCKGFNGAGVGNGNTITLDGVFGSQLTASINSLRSNMGLGNGAVTVKLFRALLNMDAFVLVSGGDSVIRQIQQSWNARYQNRSAFNYIPTDGRYSRPIQTALMYAIQYELGMDDATANGNFGNLTRTGLRDNANFGSGSSGNYLIRLFQAALRFNGYPTAYDGAFGAATATTTRSFQSFVALATTGRSDFQTWASLLVSTGDTSRPGTAADCITTITAARAQTLKANGYTTVGRYLTNTPNINNVLDKNIKPGELSTIFGAGLSIFPIFQEGGTGDGFFNYGRGLEAANRAHHAARAYGFRPGTTIYFAVDYDVLGDAITGNIVPHFRGINAGLRAAGSGYKVGIYGPRNVCTQVSTRGLAVTSFVSDMSTGFSANLGYPLPTNWAFDQILEYSIGSGAGQIGIDKNVMSGRDQGQTSVIASTQIPDEANASLYRYLAFVENAWSDYASRYNIASTPALAAREIASYLRGLRGSYLGNTFELALGARDERWVSYVTDLEVAQGVSRVTDYIEPTTGGALPNDHLFCTMNGYLKNQVSGPAVQSGDTTGWVGDLVSIVNEYTNLAGSNETGDQFGSYWIGNNTDQGAFGIADLFEDVMGFNAAADVISGSTSSVVEAVRRNLTPGAASAPRFARFYQLRFGGSLTNLRKAGADAIGANVSTMDAQTAVMLGGLRLVEWGYPTIESYIDGIEIDSGSVGRSVDDYVGLGRAFGNVVKDLVDRGF